MTARLLEVPRFVRKTRLGQGEYRKNFHQLDDEIMEAVTSPEADRVTPLMSKIYLRLVRAPGKFWEREGVLRFEAEWGEAGQIKAWAVLCETVGVASATASKAFSWLHDVGIIGYFAGKNGVGIRIFLNRAASSIGTKSTPAGKKILAFPPASSRETPASANEPAFKDSYADPEGLDTDSDPRAPQDGAEATGAVKGYPDPHPAHPRHLQRGAPPEDAPPPRAVRIEVPVGEVVARLRRELEPSLEEVARRAAAREHERTREWLESRGLPKAARVAQREAFNVLRKYGVVRGVASSSHNDVGRTHPTPEGQRPLSDCEVEDLAQACIAMFEVKGQVVELTLAEMSAEGGGFLMPKDAGRVRQKVNALLAASDDGA